MRPLLLLALLALASCRPAPSAPSTLILWAWERPEDLRFAGAAAEVAVQTRFVEYQSGYWYDDTGGISDLTCLGKCGRSAFPLHLPAFVAAAQGEALAERSAFRTYDQQAPVPAGASSLWDEALAYARAHPRDPRVPELLYRLIRVARWGANHEHLGRRAFQLLHARYANSAWAKRSPYYNDD